MKNFKTSTKSSTCENGKVEISGNGSKAMPTTMLKVVFSLARQGFSDAQINVIVRVLVNRKIIVLSGNFAGKVFSN